VKKIGKKNKKRKPTATREGKEERSGEEDMCREVMRGRPAISELGEEDRQKK
jgi:hypothetical protein